MNNLKDLVCLVAGGAGSLGFATVKNFIKQGYKVIICDLPNTNGNELATNLGNNAVFQPADVTSESDVINAFKFVQNNFGKLNVLVNCAGVGTNIKVYSMFSKKSHNLLEFQKIINTNIVGTFNTTRIACEMFALNSPGESVIINTSSISAFEGILGQSGYAASNAGINAMTLPLSRLIN